jgi:hypothetical protein
VKGRSNMSNGKGKFVVDENTGFLFVNELKEESKNEKMPDFSGVVNINGDQLQIAAWKRKSEKNGKGFLTLRISEQHTNTKNEKTAYRQNKNQKQRDEFSF